MNFQEIRQVAMIQSAWDLNCNRTDFTSGKPTVVVSKTHPKAKYSFKTKPFFTLVSYGDGLVASVDQDMAMTAKAYVDQAYDFRCFELPCIEALNHNLRDYGHIMSYMTQFFLPDPALTVTPNEDLILVKYEQEMIHELYHDKRFEMALEYNQDGKKSDVLAIAGYLNGQLVGIAGASDDADTMWQVGIDVLADYRGQNIAVTLVHELTKTILSRGIVPYYGTAWSNIASIRTAQKSGYRLAWVELSAMPKKQG